MLRNFYLSAMLLALAVMPFTIQAQDYNSLKRLSLDTLLAPFYHGVASGDPLPDAVIIWTRITTPDTGTVSGTWHIATDTLFANNLQSGPFATDASKDFTVKVDVQGLQANTFYYYRFDYNGQLSITGRTKTAPTGNVSNLRFAVASCSNYQNGYFNAYEHMMLRNDFDAVIHLGDYIYEYGANSSLPDRDHEPAHEIISLSDYRGRFSHYRLDAQLRGLHQNYPFITIWDDHESANNSWMGGAQNHTPGVEGDWVDRLDNSKTAYFEWMPIRDQATPNEHRGYRNIRYGDLADIVVIDTRVEGREEETTNTTTINDPNRTMLGTDQADWLELRLQDTTTQWKIIANQVMMAPLVTAGQILNPDQWDGYPAERQRLYNNIINNNIDNVVVITGDIHTSWANNLISGSNPGTPVGVEFVTTSITSSSGNIPIPPSTIMQLLPHVKYVDLTKKGYLILDISPTKTQSDFFYVNTISEVDSSGSFGIAWYTNDGANTLIQGTEIIAPKNSAPLVGVSNVEVGIRSTQPTELILLGAFPNPFHDKFVVQFYLQQPGNVTATMYDLAGKQVSVQALGQGTEGINLANVDGSKLPAGNYILVLDNGKQTYRKKVLKVE